MGWLEWHCCLWQDTQGGTKHNLVGHLVVVQGYIRDRSGILPFKA